MSLGFAYRTLSCFLFEPEVLLLSLLEQRTEEDRWFQWEGGHVGGKGVLGEHREITAHPLVALPCSIVA